MHRWKKTQVSLFDWRNFHAGLSFLAFRLFVKATIVRVSWCRWPGSCCFGTDTSGVGWRFRSSRRGFMKHCFSSRSSRGMCVICEWGMVKLVVHEYATSLEGRWRFVGGNTDSDRYTSKYLLQADNIYVTSMVKRQFRKDLSKRHFVCFCWET